MPFRVRPPILNINTTKNSDRNVDFALKVELKEKVLFLDTTINGGL